MEGVDTVYADLSGAVAYKYQTEGPSALREIKQGVVSTITLSEPYLTNSDKGIVK
jgi:hypothetical protein